MKKTEVRILEYLSKNTLLYGDNFLTIQIIIIKRFIIQSFYD